MNCLRALESPSVLGLYEACRGFAKALHMGALQYAYGLWRASLYDSSAKDLRTPIYIGFHEAPQGLCKASSVSGLSKAPSVWGGFGKSSVWWLIKALGALQSSPIWSLHKAPL